MDKEEKCGLAAIVDFDEWVEIDSSIGPIPEEVAERWDLERERLEAIPPCGTCELCQEVAREDLKWQKEIAMEAGMLHGADAFNEVMGWD